MHAMENKSAEAGDRQDTGLTFILIMLGLAILPLAIWLCIRLFTIAFTFVGMPPAYCYEDNFWLSSSYGLLVCFALFGAVCGLILAGIGTVRIINKQKWGIWIVIAGTFFIPFNLFLNYQSYSWFTARSSETIYKNAEARFKELARTQDRYKDEHGSYTVNPAGSYLFSDIGNIKVISADDRCYRAKAEHECIKKDYIWDSCEGGAK